MTVIDFWGIESLTSNVSTSSSSAEILIHWGKFNRSWCLNRDINMTSTRQWIDHLLALYPRTLVKKKKITLKSRMKNFTRSITSLTFFFFGLFLMEVSLIWALTWSFLMVIKEIFRVQYPIDSICGYLIPFFFLQGKSILKGESSFNKSIKIDFYVQFVYYFS